MQTTPRALLDSFFAGFNAGDLDGTANLYESSGVFVAQPGMTAEGTEAVRAALGQFFAMRPQLTANDSRIIVAGDVALALTRWTLNGTGPDGPIHMTGTATDVLRRQPDGSWRVAIDNPWGIVALEVPS